MKTFSLLQTLNLKNQELAQNNSSQAPEGCFAKSHKKNSQPKKLTLNSKSDKNQYSEWAEKGSLESNISRSETGSLAWTLDEKEGKDIRRETILRPLERSFRRLFNIHLSCPFIGTLIKLHCSWEMQHAYKTQNRKKNNRIALLDVKEFLSSSRLISSMALIRKGLWTKLMHKANKNVKLTKIPVIKEVLVIHLILPIIFFITPAMSKPCSGRFVNPISDICWSCLFPISIGPVKVNSGGREDTPNPKQIPCFCPKPGIPLPVPGIPIGFWEPARLIDITRVPFCMVSMGGLQLGKSTVGYGVHGAKGESKAQSSFYQVHWYVYPVIYWLQLLTDFLCLERQDFDVAYITELDPLWNADELSFILNPEAALFGNPIAQAACAADCGATSAGPTSGFSLDSLFWCGGCQGSLYPFTGNVAAHNGGVQGSLLLTQRMIAKLHRELLLWGTSGTSNQQICNKYPMPFIKKSQYKTQMTYPRPTTRGPLACNPLGRTEVIWGSGREFPYKGEDFGYLIWRKKNCCSI